MPDESLRSVEQGPKTTMRRVGEVALWVIVGGASIGAAVLALRQMDFHPLFELRR